MHAAARLHLSSRGQSDTLTAHFEYPSRTTAGSAIVAVEDVKLGGQLSTLHLTLWQDGLRSQTPWVTPSVSRRTVVAYTNHTNLRTFTGMSLQTGYERATGAALPPIPDFERVKAKEADDIWELSKLPMYAAHMRASRNWCFYTPRGGPLTPGVLDMWIRMKSGESIKQSALAYVVDSFPDNLPAFLVVPELRQLFESPPANPEKNRGKDQSDQQLVKWLPTIVMNLEVKTALPDEGVEWLAVRVVSRQIKDGKFDLDVIVRDVDGVLVALSYHVAMILSLERNTRKRGSAVKTAL
jgi:hypothetical protein